MNYYADVPISFTYIPLCSMCIIFMCQNTANFPYIIFYPTRPECTFLSRLRVEINIIYSNKLIFKIRVVEKNMEETLNKCLKF